MKGIFIVLSLLISLVSNATTYYVKNGGSDSSNGLTDKTAWATISKVNLSVKAGDIILFKRGNTWRNQQIHPVGGSSGAYTTYSAYGNGAKPLILGSLAANSGWTNVSGNIWQTTGWPRDVGNIIFNNEGSVGHKIMSASPELNAQGQFWYDHQNNRVRMYSTSNPASYYSNIEFALTWDAIKTDLRATYVIYEDLDFRYWGQCVMQNAPSYTIYRRLNLKYIGGGDAGQMNGGGWYGTRWGNGLQIWEADGVNITIENNRVDQCYDAGISPQGQANGSWVLHDVIIRNNIITNCEYNFEFWLRDALSSAYNIYIEHNVFAYAGYGWAHGQRPDSDQGHNLQMGGMSAKRHDIYIRNNIFYKSLDHNISFFFYNPGPGTNSYDDLANITFDYNLYYTPNALIGWADAHDNRFTTFASWQAAFQINESNGIGADPMFTDPQNGDFHIQATSPAIGRGLKVSGVITDFDGVALGKYSFNRCV